MDITFILPSPNQKPIGGYRVVYDYADRLAGRGHRVSVLFSLLDPFLPLKTPLWARCIQSRLSQHFTPNWFHFKNGVRLLVIPEISDKYVPDSDAVFATWWASAYPVSALSAAKGKKFYLIQHYEKWAGDMERLHKTYRLGLGNIVIAGWLRETLESLGAPVLAQISNGLDLDHFKLTNPIEARNPLSVAMMYHQAEWKGSKDGLQALEIVKAKYPELKVTLFSTYSRPVWLASWICFIKDPSQKQLVDIYNQNAIFVSASWSEGFGLPGAEAMACGCALATTDSGGVIDYAKNEKNALVSPPKDHESLAKNLIHLLHDQELRIRLAVCGHRTIQNFSWENAVTQLEKVLTKVVEGK